MLCPGRLLFHHLEIGVAKAHIRFEMVAFGPFIPRFEENDAAFSGPALRTFQDIPEMVTEEFRRGTMEDGRFSAIARRGVPIGHCHRVEQNVAIGRTVEQRQNFRVVENFIQAGPHRFQQGLDPGQSTP